MKTILKLILFLCFGFIIVYSIIIFATVGHPTKPTTGVIPGAKKLYNDSSFSKYNTVRCHNIPDCKWRFDPDFDTNHSEIKKIKPHYKFDPDFDTLHSEIRDEPTQ
jgi:hypothetical protein